MRSNLPVLERYNEIVERYKNGESVVSLSKSFNCGKTTIYYALEKSGIIKVKKKIDNNKSKSIVSKITKEQLAYISGFIDGEGFIGIGYNYDKQKNRYDYRVRFSISNTNKDNLIAIQEMCPLFRLSGVKKAQKTNWKLEKMLYIYKQEYIKNFLTLCLPYLIGKKDRASLVLDFIKNKNKEKRKEIYIKLKELNKRGIDTNE